MATITDISRLTGYAQSTVADILRNRPGYSSKTRQRVLDAAQQLNYEPRHSGKVLATGRSYTIGLILGSLETDLASHTLALTLSEMTRVLLKHGYYTSPLPTEPGQSYDQEVLRLIRSGRMDGFFIGRRMLGQAALQEIARRQVPAVTIDTELPSDARHVLSVVENNDREGLEAMARALREAGHQRIAYLTREQQGRKTLEQRRHELLKQIFANHNLTLLDERNVFIIPATTSTRYTEQADAFDYVFRHAHKLRNFTALICRSDAVALGSLQALRYHDIQPGRDLALIGHGNYEENPSYAFDTPFLTTIDTKSQLQGRLIAELLIQRIQNPHQPPQSRIVPQEFVYRGSFLDLRKAAPLTLPDTRM